MAERRMFAKKITESDAFLDMALSTQALYLHLGMNADDDGFINSPKKISRMIGASDDELKILLAKKFVIGFDSGIVVVKHWKMHNYIQKDRYKPTTYHDEKALLALKDNNVYTLDTECIQDVHLGKVREGKVSQGKSSIGEVSQGDIVEAEIDYEFMPLVKDIISHLNMVTGSKYKSSSVKNKSLIKARLNEGFTLEDFMHVHLVKTAEWINDQKMKVFLRPETLYSNKFEGYLNQQLSNNDKSKLIAKQTGLSDLEMMKQRGFA